MEIHSRRRGAYPGEEVVDALGKQLDAKFGARQLLGKRREAADVRHQHGTLKRADAGDQRL